MNFLGYTESQQLRLVVQLFLGSDKGVVVVIVGVVVRFFGVGLWLSALILCVSLLGLVDLLLGHTGVSIVSPEGVWSEEFPGSVDVSLSRDIRNTSSLVVIGDFHGLFVLLCVYGSYQSGGSLLLLDSLGLSKEGFKAYSQEQRLGKSPLRP